jgi:uncharacterized protein YjbI with pentapeptide repeats
MNRFVHWTLVSVAIAAALIALGALILCAIDIVGGALTVRSGLLFLIAILFLVVMAQAALHIAGAPLREQLVSDTGALVGSLATVALPDSQVPTFAQNASMVASRWIIFFASRGVVSGFLGIIATTLIGVLTVYVAFMQVRLLQSQTDTMTTENNARTLEFHVNLLISDIRKSLPVEEEIRRPGEHLVKIPDGYVSPKIVGQRINVISRTLDTVSADKSGDSLELSRERGMLLAILIAEGFPLEDAGALDFRSSDLTSIPPSPNDNMFSLGEVDLSNSFAVETELTGYDFSSAKFRNARLPIASRFEGSRFRSEVLTYDEYTRSWDLEQVDLTDAQVPTPTWLRELERAAEPNGFVASAWRIETKGGRHFIRVHPDAQMREVGVRLSGAAQDALGRCSFGFADCKERISRFCGQFSSLMSRNALSHLEKGSLFALGVKSVWGDTPIAFASFATEGEIEAVALKRKAVQEELRKCVMSASFQKDVKIDVTGLTVSGIDFAGIDLSQLDFADTSLFGVSFSGARLPAAEMLLKASRIDRSRLGDIGDTRDVQIETSIAPWINATVPTADWESKLCLAEFPNSAETDVRTHGRVNFPFMHLRVVREGDGYVLRREQCSDEELAPEPTAEQWAEFCKKCAAVAAY